MRSMGVVKRKVLLDFAHAYPEARTFLEHWYQLTRAGTVHALLMRSSIK